MTPWVLLPIKSIDLGKSRIAVWLAPEARRQLNRELLQRSLELLRAYPGLAHTCVISPCAEVLAIAGEAGATVIEQQGDGLNEAVRQALAAPITSAQVAPDRKVLILSGDLPFATQHDLRALVSSGEDVVIATDRAEQGTNAICLPYQYVRQFNFQYGPGSCALHMAAASALGLTFRVQLRHGLAFDIDTWRDCLDWQQTERLTA